MSDTPQQITFGWDLLYSCNYRCPYCGIWEKAKTFKTDLVGDDWIRLWKKVYDKYGRCHIYMSGGEPSVYGDFKKLVLELINYHLVEICTNLSWDVNMFIPHITPGKLRIAPTFHPSFADFGEFFDKAIKIKQYLPNEQVYYVVYHDQVDSLPERTKLFAEKGIKLIPQPLRGNQEVLNTQSEKKVIEETTVYSGDKLDYQLNKKSPKGKLCLAGNRYAVIRGDGLVDRCSQYSDGQLGYFTDDEFSLFPEPKLCQKEYCPIESQWIIEK